MYKFYSNPIICFQNNDIKHEGKIDFEKYSDYKARIEGRILAIETSKYR